MRNTFIFFSLVSFHCFQAQVAIGKTEITNSSVSLEFGTQNRGLILPWVTSENDVKDAENGTFIFDRSDKKVKVRSSNSWLDLSVDPSGTVDTTLQHNLVDNPTAQLVIGKNAAKNSTPGVLVLTDPDKAMILPLVASPHLNIINPAPGMMVYDTDNKQLAVFNGTVWSFWKP